MQSILLMVRGILDLGVVLDRRVDLLVESAGHVGSNSGPGKSIGKQRELSPRSRDSCRPRGTVSLYVFQDVGVVVPSAWSITLG